MTHIAVMPHRPLVKEIHHMNSTKRSQGTHSTYHTFRRICILFALGYRGRTIILTMQRPQLGNIIRFAKRLLRHL